MRRPTSALTTAILGTALTASTLSAQNSIPPAAEVPGVSPMAAARGPRHLIRNGWDYISYQEYERALSYFREAETRKGELSEPELLSLRQGIARAQQGMREATNTTTRPYALSGNRRPGAFALARPAQAGPTAPDPIQLVSGTAVANAPAGASETVDQTPANNSMPPQGSEPPATPEPPDLNTVALPPLSSAPAPGNGPLPARSEVPPALPPVPPIEPAPAEPKTTKPAPVPAVPPTLSLETLPQLPDDLNSKSKAAPVPPQPTREPEARPASTAEPAPSPSETSAPPPLPDSAPPPLPDSVPVPVPAPSQTSDPISLPDPTSAPAPAPAPTPVPIPSADPAAPIAVPAPVARPDLAGRPVAPPTPAPARTAAPVAMPPALPVRPAMAPTAEVTPRPATTRSVPAPRVALARPRDSFIPDRPEVNGSTLAPELRREVERITQRMEEDMKRGNPPVATAPDTSSATVTSATPPSTRLEISRAPSPTEARPIRAIPVPEEFVPLAPRDWSPNRKYWAAAAPCHMPLYFQDASLERYGHSTEQFFGPIGRYLSYPLDDPRQSNQRNQITQPIFSAGLFVAQIVLLPYNLIVDPPWEAEYDLGYYRPGDRTPSDMYYLPLTGVGPPLHGKQY